MRSKGAIRRQHKKQQERKIGVQLIVFMASFLAVAGGLQLWYFWYDAKASTPANLSVHATLAKPFVAHQPLKLEATIRNLGNSEAHNVAVSSAINIGYFTSDSEAFEKIRPLLNHLPDAHPLVGSGESFKQDLASPSPITPGDYESLMHGKMKVYFFSETKYSDSLGFPHQGHICEYFDPSAAVMVHCRTQDSLK